MAAVAGLIPYAANARTHSDAQIAQIAASIREWGWTTPILTDPEGGVIAGHGRLLAARQLGITEVPVMVAEGWSNAQRKAYVLADNQLALNAGWDMDMLKIELQDLHEGIFNMDLLGFDAPGLALAMGLGADFEAGTEADQGRLDEKALIICPACSHAFHK